MMYYRLHYSYDREIIGKFPQVYEAIVPTSLDDPNYISFLLWEKASNNTLVAKGVLSPHAKITDLLSCAFMGYSGRLYVSLKLKMILQKSYIGLQFLKTGLVDNKQDEEYWIINPYKPGFECLDFSKSVFFYYKDSFSQPEEQMFFTDASELIKIQKRLPIGQFIQIDKVFFKENLDVDFFALRNVGKSGTGYFVSERLKDKIEKEGCTGIVFKEPNEIYP